jgi:hypothetical protein
MLRAVDALLRASNSGEKTGNRGTREAVVDSVRRTQNGHVRR